MNSKKLGSEYERCFAKQLSKWLTGSDETLVCWRAPHSGSIGTNMKKKGKSGENVSGDFQCLDLTYSPFFNKYYIDSKCYGEFNPIIINTKNIKSNKLFIQFIKTINEAGSKIALMPTKIRDKVTPELIFIDNTFVEQDVNIVSQNSMHYKVLYQGKSYSFYIMLLSEFFELNSWQDMCNIPTPKITGFP